MDDKKEEYTRKFINNLYIKYFMNGWKDGKDRGLRLKYHQHFGEFLFYFFLTICLESTNIIDTL